MRSVFFCFIIAISSIVLTGCDRCVPRPGEFYLIQPGKNMALATGDLLGYILYLDIKQAKGSYHQWAGRKVKVTFALGQYYEMFSNAVYAGLVHRGYYQYSVDPYNGREALLAMPNSKGLKIYLSYKTRMSGTFKAAYTGKNPGQFNGRFKLVQSEG